jgi:hypothetical protein
MLLWSKEGLSRDHREDPIWDEIYRRIDSGELKEPWKEPKKTAAEWLLYLPPYFRKLVKKSLNKYTNYPGWEKKKISLYEMLFCSKEGLSRDHREAPIWDEMYLRERRGEFDQPWVDTKEEEVVIDGSTAPDKTDGCAGYPNRTKTKTATEWLQHLPPQFREAFKESRDEYFKEYELHWNLSYSRLDDMIWRTRTETQLQNPLLAELYTRLDAGEFDHQPWVDTKEEEAPPTVIDEVNVYDRVLSPDKISEMAESYLAPSPAPDMFNNPPHYTKEDLECIDAIKASLATYRTDGYAGYLKGTIMAYLWRYEDKNGVQDLRKAKWYLQKLIDHETQV